MKVSFLIVFLVIVAFIMPEQVRFLIVGMLFVTSTIITILYFFIQNRKW